MKFIETLKLAVAAIWAHKLRSALTLVGMIIGGSLFALRKRGDRDAQERYKQAAIRLMFEGIAKS